MASWLDGLIKNFTGSDGNTDLLRGLVTAGGSYALDQSGLFDADIQKTGYQGSIPNYTAQRDVVQGTYDPNRRAGSGGRRVGPAGAGVRPPAVDEPDERRRRAAGAARAEGRAAELEVVHLQLPHTRHGAHAQGE